MVQRVVTAVEHSGHMLVPHMPFNRSYARSEFVRDLVASVTVAAVLIPQSIAYALLAGLPPAHGLYAALVGGVAGALWGSSKYLATGPFSIMSLLTLTAVAPLAAPGSTEYIALVAALALLIGVIQIIFGLSRLGFLVRLVPHSVLTGFSSSAALLIIVTQVPHLLGFQVSQGAYVFQQVANIITHIYQTNIVTLLLGAGSLVALLMLRWIHPKIPATLVVILSGIAMSYFFHLGSYGVALAGDIPAHLPVTDIPTLSLPVLFQLWGSAFVMALVGFMTSYAVVKDLSTKTKERIVADQELIGQGFANLFSAIFRGFPVSGSLSRTAVNYEAGAATAWSGVYASVIVVLVILFFTPVLSYLPNATLAASVVVAVLPLIDLGKFRRMYAITSTDGVIAAVTFGAVFLLRPDEAILLGVLLALALYMRKVMWVHVVEIGMHPRWQSLVALSSFPEAVVFPRILMLRIDAPIFYANIERLELEIKRCLTEREKRGDGRVDILALDFSGVNYMDVTGIDGFSELVDDLRARHIKIYVTTPRREIREVLERGKLTGQVHFVHGLRELVVLGESMGAAESHFLVA